MVKVGPIRHNLFALVGIGKGFWGAEDTCVSAPGIGTCFLFFLNRHHQPIKSIVFQFERVRESASIEDRVKVFVLSYSIISCSKQK